MGYKKGEILRTPFESYTVEGQLGAGGSGEVYEARGSDNSLYAVKVLDSAKANATRLNRFKNEIGFCSRNTHANILTVLGSGISAKGETFYVMPKYSGTLRGLISSGIRQQDVLPLFGQILEGTEAAHLKNVWHRDLKPENVLHSQDGNTLVVADFGIAHFEEEELITAVETKNQERLANFKYASPEQKSRGNPVNHKADVYALGLILNEMFTQTVPDGSGFRTIAEVAPDYPYLDGLVDLMRRQDPNQRPSIADVKRDLIARGNEFLSLQKLSALNAEVIPETDVDDPIIRNPIALVGVDYSGGDLIFDLSAAPPPRWIREFINPRGNLTYYPSARPELFTFNGSRARVAISPGIDTQTLVNYTKDYINKANNQYADAVDAENKARIEEERRRLRERVAEETRRQEILSKIRV
jgi:serine/threonine protein kinase